MAPSVKISRKTAQALRDLVENLLRNEPGAAPWAIRSLEELRAALAPRPKKAFVTASTRKQTKAKKKRTKKNETSAIRLAIEKRADSRCECCGYGFNVLNPDEMDHFWGRGKERQTVENCWLLCRQCHRMKTQNAPMRAAWLLNWEAHSKRCLHWKEAARAQDAIEALEARAELSKGVANG